MKFSPENWKGVVDGQTYKGPQGRLQLRCAGWAALYVRPDGEGFDPETGEVHETEEVIAGYDTAFDLTMSGPYTFRVVGADASVFAPDVAGFKPEGEVYTNLDRAGVGNPMLEQVTRAMREWELRQRAERAAMRREQQEFLKAHGLNSLREVKAEAAIEDPVEPGEQADGEQNE